jgi:uncharacterized tellurite resistance protein B-like protein
MMPKKQFVMDLAKLLIAAAWVDGKLTNEEINALKDLLFNLENVAGREWAELEMYMDSPVGGEERDALLSRVLGQIQSEQDKELVLETLESLFKADGVVTEAEEAVLKEIEESVSHVGTGFLDRLSKSIKAAMGKRRNSFASAVQRDNQVDDYIENTIYYRLKSESEKKGITIGLPDDTVRKLCLAAGLMARISAVDSEISGQETQAIKDIVSAEWDLTDQEADIVTAISCDQALRGLDYFRLTRGFFECTTQNERRSFVKSLFKIANASDRTSYDETEEIRKIATSLKLTHKDFIDAKLTIPDEDREVP